MAKLPTETSVAALSAALAAPAVEKDDFADAFANFTSEKPDLTETQPDATAQAADGKEAAEGTEGTETEIEGAPGAGDEGLTAEQIAEKAEADAAKAEADAAAALEAAKKAPTDDAVTRLADMLAERTKPAPQQVDNRNQPEPLYTTQEVAKLTEFYKEWPEVAPAVEILLKGAMTNITNHIFAEVAKTLAPRMRLLEQLADNFQYQEITRTIPDYNEQLHADVTKWIEGQKGYLKAAYTNVMQEGTVDDFNDLVARYRQETGKAAPANTGNAPQQGGTTKPAPAAALTPAAKKAAAALAPVNSKRSGLVEVEPQGYDDAFDKFAADAFAKTG
jgi:hypothetical protein